MWTCWSQRTCWSLKPKVEKANGGRGVYDWEEQNSGACRHNSR